MRVLFLTLISLFLYSFFLPQIVNAVTASPSGEKEVEEIEYVLPYPGILPNSPLYPFKMFRDRVIGYLIADSLKKAEFSLLQADKRLQAGVALLLMDKRQAGLAVSTISKGENYFNEAFDEVDKARRQKRDIYDMGVKLSVAARKHEEVLMSIRSSVPRSEMGNFEKELGRVREYIEKAYPLMLR